MTRDSGTRFPPLTPGALDNGCGFDSCHADPEYVGWFPTVPGNAASPYCYRHAEVLAAHPGAFQVAPLGARGE